VSGGGVRARIPEVGVGIAAGFGAGRHREDDKRPPEGLSERGERGELVLIEDPL
jgi:hypothetical protein